MTARSEVLNVGDAPSRGGHKAHNCSERREERRVTRHTRRANGGRAQRFDTPVGSRLSPPPHRNQPPHAAPGRSRKSSSVPKSPFVIAPPCPQAKRPRTHPHPLEEAILHAHWRNTRLSSVNPGKRSFWSTSTPPIRCSTNVEPFQSPDAVRKYRQLKSKHERHSPAVLSVLFQQAPRVRWFPNALPRATILLLLAPQNSIHTPAHG